MGKGFIENLLKSKKTIDENINDGIDDFSAFDDFDKEMREIEDREKRKAVNDISIKSDKKTDKKESKRARRKRLKKEKKEEEEEYIMEDGSTTKDSSVWDSELKVISEFRVILHPELIRICKKFQKKVKDDEFSILAKGTWDSELGGIFINPEYVVPKQSVAGASVDFDEPLEPYIEKGFNVVIHSHPFDSSSFSQSDEETINTNFFCSVLFSIDSFRTATVSSMVAKDIKLKQSVLPEIAEYDIDDVKVDITNINKKISTGRNSSDWKDWNGYDERRKRVEEMRARERDSCYLNHGYNHISY